MKQITRINAEGLATNMQAILLDMTKKLKDDGSSKHASYSIKEFERLIIEQHNCTAKDAEKVTERVIDTGILRWSLTDNSFVL